MVLSVVAPKVPVEVPPVRPKTTVSPPAVKLFPAASLACKLTLILEPDPTLEAAEEMVDVMADTAPGVTDTVGNTDRTVAPFTVALTVVAVPASTPVKAAV